MNTDCDKLAYETNALANAAAGGLSRRGSCSMYAYRCHRCGMFHLASAGKRKTIYKKPKYKQQWEQRKRR